MSDNLVRDVHDAVAGASNLAEASVRPPGTTDRELAAMERDVLAKLKLQPAMSVLEIGCGIGLLGVPIAGRVTRYVGVDFAPRAVEVANQRLREASLAERALVRTLDLLSADDGEIESLGRHDRVLMYGVFHYARSEDEALQFLRSTLDLLAPGGRALIGNIPLEDLRTAWTPAPRSAQGVLGARVAAAHWAVSSSRAALPLTRRWKLRYLVESWRKRRPTDAGFESPQLPVGYTLAMTMTAVERWLEKLAGDFVFHWELPAPGVPLAFGRADLVLVRSDLASSLVS